MSTPSALDLIAEFPDRMEAETLLVDLVRASVDGGWYEALERAKAYLDRMREREETAAVL